MVSSNGDPHKGCDDQSGQFQIGTVKMGQFSISEVVSLGLESGSSLRYTER